MKQVSKSQPNTEVDPAHILPPLTDEIEHEHHCGYKKYAVSCGAMNALRGQFCKRSIGHHEVIQIRDKTSEDCAKQKPLTLARKFTSDHSDHSVNPSLCHIILLFYG